MEITIHNDYKLTISKTISGYEEVPRKLKTIRNPPYKKTKKFTQLKKEPVKVRQ